MTEPTVSYPLKDILREIRDELEQMNIKLDDKVSRADMVELQARVDKLESLRDRLLGVAAAAIAMGGAAGGVVSMIARAIGGG
ncbi:MAG: hypothetical protein FWJ87_17040 [Micromonosporaceae bacterium]